MTATGSFGSSESFHQMIEKLLSAATHVWLAARQRPLLRRNARSCQHRPLLLIPSDVSEADGTAVRTGENTDRFRPKLAIRT